MESQRGLFELEREPKEEPGARLREAYRRYKQSSKGRTVQRRQNKQRYHRLRAQGLCALCGKVPVSSFVHCANCKAKILAGTTAWKQRMRDTGMCNRCGKMPCLETMKDRCDSFCERCYFKKTSTDCLKTAAHAEMLGQKLKAQNYRCAYTGEEIILGLNDSLDHILPISKYPELRHDPENTEWVTRKVNCMKWDSTRDEFIATAYAVVRYYESGMDFSSVGPQSAPDPSETALQAGTQIQP